jgi:hypothetical protein
MTPIYVVTFLIGLGFFGLGASLVATGHPRRILNRRSRAVPAAVRWQGAASIAGGIIGMSVIWLPFWGTAAPEFVVMPSVLAIVGCSLMAGRAANRRANHNITVH